MEPYLQTLAFEQMLQDIKQMNAQQLSDQLKAMGCGFDYAQLREMLAQTYNDLGVADEVFSRFSIQEVTYPKAFIDEAILEIAKRENFGFVHYGVLSEQIHVIINSNEKIAEKLTSLELAFRKLCQCANHFDVKALEVMQYQANDGIDVYAILMQTLDLMLQEALKDPTWYQHLIRMTQKILTTFTQSHMYIKAGILYEQATAYIALKSKKGTQLFESLLATHDDPCDVVLHYALAYLEIDEKKAMRILMKYQTYWDEKSDAFEVIQALLEEHNCNGGIS